MDQLNPSFLLKLITSSKKTKRKLEENLQCYSKQLKKNGHSCKDSLQAKQASKQLLAQLFRK